MVITDDVVPYTTLVKYYDNQFIKFYQNNYYFDVPALHEDCYI